MEQRQKRLIIITGLSGAGKSTAVNLLEDLGFYVVDNLPCEIVPHFLQSNREKVALGIDIRSLRKAEELTDILDRFDYEKTPYFLLFLEASEEAILNRYNLTRRRHPLIADTLLKSIRKEREIMSVIRDRASDIIDTSDINPKDFPDVLKRALAIQDPHNDITIHVTSFGFKYGVPIDVDLLFDVRFLPNPYYYAELKPKNGEDKEILDFLLSHEVTRTFYTKLIDLLEFLIPNYIKEGKKHLTIAMGCSGGKHRSVALAWLLYRELLKKENLNLYLSHREKERGNW
ncbi:MAG: RNase adapter RapZ [Fusobacteriaceae bacterium]|jgi:UPF0042 nucleotide-binding protein|nr:RNase adapter RapZ [Fusobacteriaceae bacterium]